MRTRFFDSSARGAQAPISRAVVWLVATVPAATLTLAQEPGNTDVEQVVVVGERVYPVVDTVAPSTSGAVDTAELLRRLPGANLNANGMLSGIAQYRGLYGDRVAVSIDGLRTTTGGPNAMDAPLSYASPLLLDHLSLERGIASVSSAIESIGGHIEADHNRGEHSDQSEFGFTGKAEARYASNGGLNSTAVQLVGANDMHKVALLAQHDDSDDLEYPDGKLIPTRLNRDRYDLSYAYRNDGVRALIYAGRLDTTDTGTPSLPMDILYIDTDMYGLRVDADLAAHSALEFSLNSSSIDHVMDNFGLRTPPPSPMNFRSTHATGDGNRWRVGGRVELDSGTWRLGLDGESDEHSATITNPNVPPFRIDNFNAAQRDIVGLYGQWNRSLDKLDLEAGVRLNRVQVDSGPVSATIPPMNPMMQMMAMNAALLANAFNGADLDRSLDNVDAVLKIGHVIGANRNVYLELGRKTRAPSYQELYLWLPLEATGGLADGRSYIGNPLLDSEVSHEINVGSNWQTTKAYLAPQVFYKRIDDYIQGVPSTNAIANLLAMMMTGQPALEFANTDAEIYGIDLGWGYYLSDKLTLDGVLTHVRGRRTDVSDNLYRLAPFNARIGLTYETRSWSARIESIAYARQDKVSSYNEETPTPGYGMVNVSIRWRLESAMQISASISNLLDKRYQDHLDGINRVAGVDVPVGERLYGLGRSLQVGVRYNW
jgi:iron complex outermembrane recepter protein